MTSCAVQRLWEVKLCRGFPLRPTFLKGTHPLLVSNYARTCDALCGRGNCSPQHAVLRRTGAQIPACGCRCRGWCLLGAGVDFSSVLHAVLLPLGKMLCWPLVLPFLRLGTQLLVFKKSQGKALRLCRNRQFGSRGACLVCCKEVLTPGTSRLCWLLCKTQAEVGKELP